MNMNTLVLASLPRCGSTYLARSIAGLPQGGGAPDGGFGKHGIHKTHRTPDGLKGLDWDHRPIFLHGSVSKAVLSTQKHRHDPQHFANCGKEYDPDVNLIEEDYLDLERLARSWLQAPVSTLCVRYESLRHDDVRDFVQEWVGRPVSWLPWRDRSTDVVEELSVEQIGKLWDAYHELDELLAELPDVVIRSG